MNIGTKLVLGVSAMALAIAAVGYYSVAHLERASLNSIGDDVLHDVLVAKRSLMAAWLVATLLAVLGGVWLARSISRPIKRLTRVASDIAGGDFKARVESTGGSDEIARLGETFNQMTRHLVEANLRLARRQQELEVAAVAREDAHESLQLQTFALRRSEEQLAEFRKFAEASGQG
ncbi:MAG: HAMP domain-containing protein, partial [Planctomycetes bacterium]|nr:HAMP domain-containing protein [Planctomycetota bacterium]